MNDQGTYRRLAEQRHRMLGEMTRTIDQAEGERRSLTTTEQARLRRKEADLVNLDAELEHARSGLGAHATREQMRSLVDDGSGEQTTSESGGLGGWLAGEMTRSLFGSTGVGQYVTPPEYAPIVWDFLAASSVLMKMGCQQIVSEREILHIPTATSDPAASWIAEGAAISPADPGLSEKIATPRKLGALVQLSNEILSDAVPPILDQVLKQVMRALALKLDLTAFEGSGTPPEPQGIKNTSGITTQSLGTNGAAITADDIATAIGTLASLL